MYYDVSLEIDYEAIGKRIRKARENKGLKQHNLAALAEVAATNISHIERGVAKVGRGLRFTQFRGLARLKMQVLFTFARMNLKKPAKWKRKMACFHRFCFIQ